MNVFRATESQYGYSVSFGRQTTLGHVTPFRKSRGYLLKIRRPIRSLVCVFVPLLFSSFRYLRKKIRSIFKIFSIEFEVCDVSVEERAYNSCRSAY